MKLKVCGITKAAQLIQLDNIGIDYAGLIFYDRSVRYVLDKLKSTEVQPLNLRLKKVGVFVNASEEDIMTQAELYGLDMVQLHGDETPAFCEHISNQVKVIKAFRITNRNEQNIDWMIRPYEECCDFYLFDTNRKGAYGGTGEKFEWEILKKNKINKQFFLSGGIGLADIERINAFEHPFLYAVDVNSKVETEDGIKDIVAITQLAHELLLK
ncbi:MAG: phosphoribosylanthranilate isomerase [Chitinophagaceae bacterium]|nr:phosphoribosylanthranilate isomerase [Chitinophagaceae bacterium]